MPSKSSQILIISPEPWEAHFVSKHHYAMTLASQGHRVYFLNPPNDKIENTQILPTKYKNLYTITDKRVAKGLRFYPKFIREYLEKKWLFKLEKKVDIQFAIIWLFENSRFYDMAFAKERIKIYHQVDLNQNFHLKEASLSADICLGTTDYIVDEIKKYNTNVYKIHHGVSQQTPSLLSTEQETFFIQSPINVIYVGNLDIVFLDVEILISLIKNHPDSIFHLVGQYDKTKKLYQECKKFKNILWWGLVESALIPQLLLHSDILLLVYEAENEEDKKQLASPHKIMEYLASGKVTVATYTDEYKDKRELLEMVDDSYDYREKFNEVVNNLDFYNSSAKQKIRIAFAHEHRYERQITKIFKLIQQQKDKNAKKT